MTIVIGKIVDFSFLFRGKLLSKAVMLRISADIIEKHAMVGKAVGGPSIVG